MTLTEISKYDLRGRISHRQSGGKGMKLRTVIRRLLKLAAVLSFITFLIGIASIYVIGAENNPFLPYHTSESSIVGPLYFIVFIALGGIFFGSLIMLTVLNLFEWLFLSNGGSSGQQRETERSREHPEAQLHQFNRANKYLALIFLFLFVIAVESATLISSLSGTPFAAVGGFLVFATGLLGGLTTHLLNFALFGAAWIGIRNYNATEGWVLGIVGWVLFTLSGLIMLSISPGAIAIVAAGLQVLRSGYRGRKATKMRFADKYVSQLREQSVSGNSRNTQQPTSGPVEGDTNRQDSVADLMATLREREIRSLDDVRAIVDVDPEFVHPSEADDARLTYWSYLSYGLGGLTVLSSLLIGIELWGFPSLGFWGILFGAVYLGHAFGIPQHSSFAHVAGLAWYVFGSLVSLYTVSLLALLANVGGIYLGWTTMQGVRQPDELVADLQDPSASAPGGELVGGGLVGGVVLGAVLGVLGAIVFAVISRTVEAVYGIFLILPAVAAGFGVSLGVGEKGGLISGLIGAGFGVGSIILGFRLLLWLLPQGYQLQDPSLTLLLPPLVGIYIAYRLGKRETKPPHSPVNPCLLRTHLIIQGLKSQLKNPLVDYPR